MKIIGMIPARLGSTRVINKNLRLLDQKPLVQHILDAAKGSKLLNDISRLVSDMMQMPVQPNKAIVGDNAFAHSSGIHQDGVIKNRENYEIINPLDVGVNHSAIILTARSGRAAVAYRAKNLGHDLTKAQLNDIYDRFIRIADTMKEVSDETLLEIISNKA